MKRRQFVGTVVSVAAAAMWPAFVREAFAKGPECSEREKKKQAVLAEMAVVANAFRQASKSRKPLVVFVVPKDGRLQFDRGQAFGEFLNYGKDEDLAPLADCEVVCATMRTLRRIVPSVEEGEPLMVLIRADALPATSRHMTADLPTWRDAENGKLGEAGLEEVTQRRISTLGSLLREGLGHEKHRIAARAARVRAALKDKSPNGTQWARSYGCGIMIEELDTEARVGCGMAYVPEKSQRFLYFYSSEQG